MYSHIVCRGSCTISADISFWPRNREIAVVFMATQWSIAKLVFLRNHHMLGGLFQYA